jgi:hypothetical protein
MKGFRPSGFTSHQRCEASGNASGRALLVVGESGMSAGEIRSRDLIVPSSETGTMKKMRQ